MTAKKFFIETYGCAMNTYDSGRISDVLLAAGFDVTNNLEAADVIIFNTCSIREKAFNKVFSNIGRALLKKKKGAVVGLAGCVASQLGEEAFSRNKDISFVLGPRSYPYVNEIALDALRGVKRVEVELLSQEKFLGLPVQKGRTLSATLAISEGCDNFCTYCVVPYTRGREYSRTVAEVVEEAKRLVKLGAKDILLLGQNVNSYHGLGNDGKVKPFGYLLSQVAEVEGVKRLRYVTSYPSKVDEELIEAHAKLSNLVPFVNLPIQAGSDRILKKMNRQYDQATYRKIIEAFRKKCSRVQFSSDFIVGFPGETEEDFAETLKVAKEFSFINSYCFPYSRRPGTPAASMPDQIPLAVKKARLAVLQKILQDNQIAFNDSCRGQILEVLVDGKKKSGEFIGKSEYMQNVVVRASEDVLGELVRVRISSEKGRMNLEGEVIKDA